MHYLDLSIVEIHQALLENKVTPLELVLESIKRAKNNKDNCFEYICEKEAVAAIKELENKDKNNILWGIPYTLKDNISTKDIPTSASSKLLDGYVPVFSSEVYERLQKAGAILIGKTTLDELGIGSSGTLGRKGKTYNPWDKTHTHMIGGSSSGSAASVCSRIVPFSLGSDTGNSVRLPASFSGLVGLKPSWGRISRYGLFPLEVSMDHIGIFARNVKDSAIVLSTLAGHDEKDMTSSLKETKQYENALNLSPRDKRIAVIKEFYDSFINQNVKEAFDKTLNKMKEKGAKVDFVSIDRNLCLSLQISYSILSAVGAMSNNANLDGVRFGPSYDEDNYEENVVKARSEFQYAIKRRFAFGAYVISHREMYENAKRVRHLVVKEMKRILNQYDAIYLPTTNGGAPLFSEKANMLDDSYLLTDKHLLLANFAGLPSINIPLGFDNGLPFGATITAGLFKEELVLSLAASIEEITGLKDLVIKE